MKYERKFLQNLEKIGGPLPGGGGSLIILEEETLQCSLYTKPFHLVIWSLNFIDLQTICIISTLDGALKHRLHIPLIFGSFCV